MGAILAVIIAAIFTHNIVLVYILGLCPTIGVSKNLDTAVGMGTAVTLVITITTVINWLVYNLILVPAGAELVSILVYMLTIAATVQLLEMILEKYFSLLYMAFGVYLPLITVNCTVLGATLFMVLREFDLGKSLFYGFGTGLGFLLAITLVAGIRQKLNLVGDPPKGLRGAGLTMIVLGILALGFMGFGGMVEL